jgi:hypothetical protein
VRASATVGQGLTGAATAGAAGAQEAPARSAASAIAADLTGSRVDIAGIYELATVVKNEPPNCEVAQALSDGQQMAQLLENWMPLKEWLISQTLFTAEFQLALLPDPERPMPGGMEMLTETAMPPTDQLSDRYIVLAFQGQHPHQAAWDWPGPKVMVATHQPDCPFTVVENQAPVLEHEPPGGHVEMLLDADRVPAAVTFCFEPVLKVMPDALEELVTLCGPRRTFRVWRSLLAL